MILQALYRHFETLVEKNELSVPGWDDGIKVSFSLDLDNDGNIVNVQERKKEQQRGKKTVFVPDTMKVPAHTGRTVGISANFLCDNSSYMLGADAKGKPKRAVECFTACAEFHRNILDGVESPTARAILKFFDKWDPAAASTHPMLAQYWKEITDGANLIFSYDGKLSTDDSAICEAWQRYYDAVDPDAPHGQCLITGEEGEIAEIHPPIRGMKGAQSSGAALISFNAPAFCSYGHEQSLNAPVGIRAAFAYTAALNHLIADREHCRTVGNTTIVCWAEHGDSAYQDFGLASLFGSPPQTVDDTELTGMLKNMTEGKPVKWNDRTLDPGEHFYFLGLTPNAARLSVRFFLCDTMGEFAKHIQQHYEDIDIVKPAYDNFQSIPLWKLASETVNQKSKNKDSSPQMTGDLFRSVLTGVPYPATLINGVQLRIRAEHEVTRGRAAIIKGYYRRFYRDETNAREKEVFTVKLNENSTYQPYVLGRLFSVLEALQEEANPGINATIKDKYFNAASATPVSVFPLLIKLAQKHLHKLETNKEIKKKGYFDKQIAILMGMMDESFPARMTLPEQGAFQIGYYHQTQKRYTKKEESKNA